IELGSTGRRIGPEDRGVERIGFGCEPNGVRNYDRMLAQAARRTRRAGECYDVLTREVFEQVASTATDELQAALREDPGLDNATNDELRQIRRRRRRLDDGRHTRNQRGRELFEHAPDRKVERVDVNRCALQRRADVLADEGSGLREHLGRAIHVNTAVWQ